MPEAASLFLSPHYLPSLALATAVTVFGVLGIEQRQQAVAATASSSSTTAGSRAGSSSSMSSPSSGSTSTPRERRHATRLATSASSTADATWREAGSMLGDITPCQQHLFEVLGVDSRVLLWVACADSRCSDRPCVLHNAATCLATALKGVRDFWQLHATPEQHQQQDQLRAVREKIHMLLPALLMHQAAGLPHPQQQLFKGLYDSSPQQLGVPAGFEVPLEERGRAGAAS